MVLHPDLKGRRRTACRPEAALEEAMALARAMPGVELVDGRILPVPEPRPGTLFGRGQVDALAEELGEREIALVLVDGPLSPVQQRNLEKAWGVKILDRTGLILEIFADRAATREGVLQGELAALAYQRTRLVRAWTHLERQRGGLGFVGGPGETQVEADRRAIDEAMVRLRRQLARVRRTRDLHRRKRARVPWPVIALVGYTNAGKSTLFNRLTGAEVMAKDMLFATLDPTMRGIDIPGAGRVILSDTVGFITDLPTQLVAAFRATLEEVTLADLIVHVRDITHPETETQAREVERVLEELGVDEQVPRIEVWNKLDRLGDDEARAMIERAGRAGAVALSALAGQGLDTLCARIADALGAGRQEEEIRLDYTQARLHARLHASGLVLEDRPGESGWEMRVRWTRAERARLLTDAGAGENMSVVGD